MVLGDPCERVVWFSRVVVTHRLKTNALKRFLQQRWAGQREHKQAS